MPSAQFGERIALETGNPFIQVKNEGDSITFRFVKGGIYDGKHFQQRQDGKWDVTMCPRIMENKACNICEQYFELREKARQLKDSGASQNEIQAVLKKARPYGPKITFYYPILDRGTQSARILKTTLSVRTKIEDFVKQGINILNTDFVLTNTKRPGADYYALLRKDSSETQPLTEKEKKELEVAQAFDMENIVGSTRRSKLDIVEPEGEEIPHPAETAKVESKEKTPIKKEVEKEEIDFDQIDKEIN